MPAANKHDSVIVSFVREAFKIVTNNSSKTASMRKSSFTADLRLIWKKSEYSKTHSLTVRLSIKAFTYKQLWRHFFHCRPCPIKRETILSPTGIMMSIFSEPSTLRQKAFLWRCHIAFWNKIAGWTTATIYHHIPFRQSRFFHCQNYLGNLYFC